MRTLSWSVALTSTVSVLSVMNLAACKDLSGDQPLPSNVPNPSTYQTSGGALQRVDGTRALFRTALNRFVLESGELTDELTEPAPGDLDLRNLNERKETPTNDVYRLLQNVRVQTDLAVKAIAAYGTDIPPAVLGEVYGMEGYTEIMLADLFCSGVPLTTLAMNADIQYAPGTARDSLYMTAVAHFDSAIAISSDSVRIMTMARVGKARAQLALAQYDAAAQSVASVHDGDSYQLFVVLGQKNTIDGAVDPNDYSPLSVGNREGRNGLAFLNGDPRTPSAAAVANGGFSQVSISVPAKYLVNTRGDSAAFVLADWVEARLIEAENQLQHGDTVAWRTTLNHLRLTAPVPGGTGPLDTLADPGTASARVDTLFAERAEWLYLTGHRQGDLRRLIRQYRRSQGTVYPTGPTKTGVSYGSSITAPLPPEERINPQYHGCINRDA